MRRWLAGLLALVLVAASGREVLAHGGGTPRLVNAPVGPYVVSVWSTPDRPLAGGDAHFSVAVAELARDAAGLPAPGAPVLDATVALRMHPPGGGAPLLVEALPATAGGELYYEGDAQLGDAGSWQVEIGVTGSKGSGEASFALTVVAATPSGWLYIAAAITAVALAGWLISRQSGRAAPAPRRPEEAR